MKHYYPSIILQPHQPQPVAPFAGDDQFAGVDLHGVAETEPELEVFSAQQAIAFRYPVAFKDVLADRIFVFDLIVKKEAEATR